MALKTLRPSLEQAASPGKSQASLRPSNKHLDQTPPDRAGLFSPHRGLHSLSNACQSSRHRGPLHMESPPSPPELPGPTFPFPSFSSLKLHIRGLQRAEKMLSRGSWVSKKPGSMHSISWVKYYRILFIRDFDIYVPRASFMTCVAYARHTGPVLGLMSHCHQFENSFLQA